ncbi:MAG: 6-carboxytetrahydropterin synthase QueD, partial [Thermodesulfobacteriota bacterium]|nr:6-carboxytetrahydropterin synthase QueD [Thermodesulfobacteriota bacterium]
MYKLKVISQFAAAHSLRNYDGDCEKLHGHNWKIEVQVTGSKLGKDGLLIDFRVVKHATKKILDRLDHGFLNELEPFRTLNPSSENIACYLFKALSRELNSEVIKVSEVTAWESDT